MSSYRHTNLEQLLGSCITLGGVRYHAQLLVYTPAGIMAHLGAIPTIFAILLSIFYTSRINSMPSEIIAGVLFLSRSIAIITLILWFGFLCFRYVTHSNFFYEEEGEQPNEELDDVISPLAASVLLLVSVTLLAICCDNLAQPILQCSESQTKLLGLFFVPAATKVWTHVPAMERAWGNKVDYTLDWTVGAGLYTVLCVGPSLVILGWIIGVPMDLRFGLMETVSYSVAVWTVNLVIVGGVFNYVKGVAIVTLFSLIVLGFVIYLV